MTWAKYVPNALTLLRLGMSVPIGLFLWNQQLGWAFLFLIVAGITDLADGAIAREFNFRTSLGAWLDPIADKTLIATILITLMFKGWIPVWFCVLTVFRDVLMSFGTLLLVARKAPVKIRPLLTGKFAIVLQNFALLMGIFSGVAEQIRPVANVIYAISALFTMVSFAAYARVFLKLYHKTNLPPGFKN